MVSDMIFPDWPAPKNIRALMTTRQTDMTTLDLPAEPIWLHQVHGSSVIAADEAVSREADAAYTQKTNIICAVRTADCLPILLCDIEGTVVAAIHAGWRGLASGIIEATLQKLPVAAERLLAWLGAAIGPRAFEVGEDVREKFSDNQDHAAFSIVSADKYLCNIYTLARNRLVKYGVPHIYGGLECTYTQAERFYSHRRAKDKERMASLIWMSSMF